MRSLATPQAHRLMLEGAVELAEVEANGIRIDIDRLKANRIAVKERMGRITTKLKSQPLWALMRRKFGQGAKLTAGEQVGAVVFSPVEDGGLGYINHKKTPKGTMAVDAEVFAPLVGEVPWLAGWAILQKLVKVDSTYLAGIERETHYTSCRITGNKHHILRPWFNLNSTDTYRSSCDSPNFQNMPIRDPQWAELIRTCIVPRPGYRIVEVDFSGAEVRVAACYHRDPAMIRYLSGGGDMHFDSACDVFMTTKDKLTRACRNMVKGMFVFAEFYGDYWRSVAQNIWEGIEREGLTLADGTPLKAWLAGCGITELGTASGEDGDSPLEGTFQHHIQQVEQILWKQRFPVYDKWRRDFYSKYLESGEFTTHTGFHLWMAMRRNAVINNPVQGSSFHCLLWSLIQIGRRIRKTGMPAGIIGQIHDSIIAEVQEDAVPAYLAMCKQVIEVELKQHFPWLTVGMTAEAKVSETFENSGSWFRMTEMAL